MKLFFVILVLCPQLFAAENSADHPQVILGVWDQAKKSDYESRIAPVLQGEVSGCADCVIKNYSPYDAQGNFISDESSKGSLELLAQEAHVIFLNHNERVNAANKVLIEIMKKAQTAGHVIVIAAGQPGEHESSAPLSQTVAGQIPNALIIGELGERDRLLGASYFGPEMLTALRPPKEQIGQGVAPAIFAGRLTKAFHRKSDWVKYLTEKKLVNKKIWLEINDCFKIPDKP